MKVPSPHPQRWRNRRHPVAVAACVAAAAFSGCASAVSLHGAPPSASHPDPLGQRISDPTRLLESYGRLPLGFEPNVGQADGDVRFVSRARGATLLLKETEAVVALAGALVRIAVLGGPPRAELAALEPLPGRANYILGSDPASWRTGVPRYGRVRYRDVYPGIDLVFHGDQRALEYDFVVAPGASPGAIRVRIDGADDLRLDGAGNLVIATAAGELVQHAPVAYQEIDGTRVAVESAYSLPRSPRPGTVEVAFDVGRYDATLPLVIDPTLVYSTYFGRAGSDAALGVAIDDLGNAYIAGETASTNLATPGAFQGAYGGGLIDAFVAKLSAAGNSLHYVTYLGGSGFERALAIAVDAAGSAYVTGFTSSTNFPTFPSPGALQPALAGEWDVFVAKLGAAGDALAYSTYLGGAGGDEGRGIVVDAAGSAFVTGKATVGFPTHAALQPSYGGSSADAFVSKLAPDGVSFVYSTYLGRSGPDEANAIAVDGAGSAYVVGSTVSTNLATPGAFQGSLGGFGDAFVTKLSAAGDALAYATYLGGGDTDNALGVAVDAAGSAYVTGSTSSTNFPTAAPIAPSKGAGTDAFVTKLSPAGDSLVYSTYLGGNASDGGRAIALDAAGSAYVTGETSSNDFPLSGVVRFYSGSAEAFVTKLSAAGTSFAYSTYLGGNFSDRGSGIVVDAYGNAYVAGSTCSTNFPVAGGVQGSLGGGCDAFVSKLTTCGDTFVDPLEQCDEGGLNGTPRSCCDGACRLKSAGTACDDGNGCTETDRCDAGGGCIGEDPVVCTPSGPCFDATCFPATGECFEQRRADGASCSDGDACTEGEVCRGESCIGAPVACTASDACHDAGTCDPATGECSDPVRPDGTACDDANACTETDVCRAGSCAGSDPVVCRAEDVCHDPGTCDPVGGCSNPPFDPIAAILADPTNVENDVRAVECLLLQLTGRELPAGP